MGIFDFKKDAGDNAGAKMDDEAFKELRQGNLIAQKMIRLGLKTDGLRVNFDDGVVTLSGTVADQDTRERMVLIAGNTPGVSRVDDRLQVSGGGATVDLSGRTYTVEKGDTLSGIAQEKLGNASRWKEIFEANKPMLSDPDKIYPGQVLRMPA